MFPRYLLSGHVVYVTKGVLFAVPFDLDRQEVRGPASSLQEVSADTNLGTAQIDFGRNGTIAYRSGRTEGLSTIQWLDGVGHTEPLAPNPGIYLVPRLSPDGRRLAVRVTEGSTSDIWIYDLQRGSRTRLTSGTGLNSWPIWTPDGQYLIFQSVGGMFWMRANGATEPEPLTHSNTLQFPNSFNPDGTRLAFTEMTAGGVPGAEIRTVRVDNVSGRLQAGAPQSFLKTSTANASATFSPDGRWLAYADAEGGQYEVYVRAFPDDGTKVQISNAGGLSPAWSRTAPEIFYRTEDQRILVAHYTIEGASFVPDKPRVWFGQHLADLGTAPDCDLAPDGKRFVVLMPAENPEPRDTHSHVTLVVNFFDEVRRRVASHAR